MKNKTKKQTFAAINVIILMTLKKRRKEWTQNPSLFPLVCIGNLEGCPKFYHLIYGHCIGRLLMGVLLQNYSGTKRDGAEDVTRDQMK